MSATFDRLEGEVTLRLGYLSNREKVCNILAMGYDPEAEPGKKANGVKYYSCMEAEKTKADLKKRWTGKCNYPFEVISEGWIENEQRKWKAPVPHHERREPRKYGRANVGQRLDIC